MTWTPYQAFTEEEEVVFILKLGLIIRLISRVLSTGENTHFEFEDTYAKASGPRWSQRSKSRSKPLTHSPPAFALKRGNDN